MALQNPPAPGQQPTLEEQARELEEKVARAQSRSAKAERLISDPLLQEALDAHETAIFFKWKQSRPQDAEAREFLYHDYRALSDLRDYLQQTAESGKVAAMTAARVLGHGGRSTEPRSDDS